MGKVKNDTADMFGGEYAMEVARKETMNKAREKGCRCPVCNQFVKVYSRTINSTMARQLVHAYNGFGVDKFFHVSNMVLGGASSGDFPKLLYWGLIKEQHHVVGDDNKRTSGVWAVTQKGADFVNAKLTVPKYAVLYDAKLLELNGPAIGIRDALGNKFDYKVLMAPAITSQNQGAGL